MRGDSWGPWLLFAGCAARVSAQCRPISAKVFLQNLTDIGYDRTETPVAAANSTAAVDVQVQFELLKVRGVQAPNGRAQLLGYMNYWWNDQRLAYKDWENASCSKKVNLRSFEYNMIWEPDIYVDNLVRREQDSKLDVAIGATIDPDGTVHAFSQRVLSLRLKYKLKRLPLDSQEVKVDMASYSYAADSVRLRAKGGSAEDGQSSGVGMLSDKAPSLTWKVGANEDMEAAKPFQTQGAVFFTDFFGRSYSNLQLSATLSRQARYYEFQVILPIFFVLVICYLQFWVDPDKVPARATLATFPVLIVNTMISRVYTGLPKGSQNMWMTDWLLIALTACVLAGLTLGPVQYYRSLEKSRSARRTVLRTHREELLKLTNKGGTHSLSAFFEPPPTPSGGVSSGANGADLDGSEPLVAEQPNLAAQGRQVSAHDKGITELQLGMFKVLQDIFKGEDKDGGNSLDVWELQRVFVQFDTYVSAQVLCQAACAFMRDQGKEAPDEEMDFHMSVETFAVFLLEAQSYLTLYKLALPGVTWRDYIDNAPTSDLIDSSCRAFYLIVLGFLFVFFIMLSSGLPFFYVDGDAA